MRIAGPRHAGRPLAEPGMAGRRYRQAQPGPGLGGPDPQPGRWLSLAMARTQGIPGGPAGGFTALCGFCSRCDLARHRLGGRDGAFPAMRKLLSHVTGHLGSARQYCLTVVQVISWK